MRAAQRTVLPILVAVFAMTSAGAGGGDDAAKKEIKRFQGAWKAVGGRSFEGKEVSEAELQNTRLTVDGDKFTLTMGNITVKGTFTVDPAKNPHTIDATLKGDKDTKVLGIYQIKNDIRKSCFAEPGKDRPAKFTTERGYITFEWKRE